MSLADVVARHPLFERLPGDTAQIVAGCARLVSAEPGGLLLAEGEPADTFYLLRRGRVAIEAHSPRGPLVIETVGPGHVVGWSWMFPPYRWQFDARAVDAVGAVALDGACLRHKADADPAFGYALLQSVAMVLVERLQAARIRLLDLYGDGDHR
jgi:CRP/FNR family transcriptional regulator, cyclic AMP receptor protein